MISNSEPRKFFLRPSRSPWPRSHILGEQKALALVLRMICCNHGLMGDFMGPFTGPLVSSQTRCFMGATRSFMGSGPLGPPHNSITGTTERHVEPILAYSCHRLCCISTMSVMTASLFID